MNDRPQHRLILLCVAAPKEARAVADAFPNVEPIANTPWPLTGLCPEAKLLETGVGKSNAAAALAWTCADPGTCPPLILNLGLAGLLPSADFPLGSPVRVRSAVFADEGLVTPTSFSDLAQMGFPPLPDHPSLAFSADPAATAILEPLARPLVTCATVSTCSGTNDHARTIAARTGAHIEDMETAALAATAARLGIPFAAVRVVSNTTGDRDAQTWDLPGSLDALRGTARALAPLLGDLARATG